MPRLEKMTVDLVNMLTHLSVKTVEPGSVDEKTINYSQGWETQRERKPWKKRRKKDGRREA